MEFQHGKVYRLTRDVTNPKVDRRGKHFRRNTPSESEWINKMEVWPKGMRFRYVVRTEEMGSGKIHTTKRFENFDGQYHYPLDPEDWNDKWEGKEDTKNPRFVPNPKWVALVEALEEEPESFVTMMARVADSSDAGANYAWDILGVLFERGVVTEEQIKSANEALSEVKYYRRFE
jgi:hypothetical protein